MEERIPNGLTREEKIRLAKSQYAFGPGRMYDRTRTQKRTRTRGSAPVENKKNAHSFGFQIRIFLSATLFLFFFALQKWDLSMPFLDTDRIYEVIQADEGLDGLEKEIISVFNQLH